MNNVCLDFALHFYVCIDASIMRIYGYGGDLTPKNSPNSNFALSCLFSTIILPKVSLIYLCDMKIEGQTTSVNVKSKNKNVFVIYGFLFFN